MSESNLSDELVAKTIAVLLAKTQDATLKWEKYSDATYYLRLDIGTFRLAKDYDEVFELHADYSSKESKRIAGIEYKEELKQLYAMAYNQNPNVENFIKSFIKKYYDF